MRFAWRALTLALITLSACGNSQENHRKALDAAQNVIINAEALDYDDLTPDQQQSVGDTATYSRTGGWMSSDLVRFDSKTAAYVRAVISRSNLAFISLLYSCGSATYVQACSEETLSRKVSEVYLDRNAHALYGKYMNSWEFRDGNQELPRTTKFDGYRTLGITSRLETDEVIIGPIPGRPTRMIVQIYHNFSEDKRTLPSPESAVKMKNQ